MDKTDIGNFLAGACIGAVVALLVAPQPGKAMRAQITKAANDSKGAIDGYGETVQGAVIEIIDRGKAYVFRQRRGVAEAIRRGSEVYRRTG